MRRSSAAPTVRTSSLAALAVVAGTASLVGPALFGWSGMPLAIIEVALLVFIGINTWFGQRRDWHNC
jgi:hypothetical protein